MSNLRASHADRNSAATYLVRIFRVHENLLFLLEPRVYGVELDVDKAFQVSLAIHLYGTLSGATSGNDVVFLVFPELPRR